MTRAVKWLVGGGLVLLATVTVGVVVSSLALAIVSFVLFYCLGRGAAGRWSPTIVMFLIRNTGAISTAFTVLGATGGLFLGIWLIRRLFGARPARS